MVRWVKKSAKQPAVIDVAGKKTVSVCVCGLTGDPDGLCDGSHAAAQDEKEGRAYVYDKNLGRKEIGEEPGDHEDGGCNGCC